MRIYFLSERTAGLKLNGAYLGLIDKFERFVDIDVDAKLLAEAVPDGDALPLNFFIDKEFFTVPPDFADVYTLGESGDAVIYLARYKPRADELKTVAQTRFCGGLYTLFLNGGSVYLNCETDKCRLHPLPRAFADGKLNEATINGHPALILEGAGCIAIFSDNGEKVFYNPAESWSCGEKLEITVNFFTCAGSKARCTFAYDGVKMTLENSVTEEYMPPNEDILHFAFFESVLTHGDFARYLSEELQPNANALNGFLGDFTDVTVPYSRFFEEHGDIKAAGLVYPVKENLFKVRYFAVDIEGGKITNVYEVD